MTAYTKKKLSFSLVGLNLTLNIEDFFSLKIRSTEISNE